MKYLNNNEHIIGNHTKIENKNIIFMHIKGINF